VLVALVLAIAGPDQAQEAAPDPAGLDPDHSGYALYQSYCAECHGVRADGRGAKAALFQPPPPELTRLAQRDGVEPRRESLMLVIDGRRTAKGPSGATGFSPTRRNRGWWRTRVCTSSSRWPTI
jgi:hypothetical protein